MRHYYAIRQDGWVIPATVRHLRREAIKAVVEMYRGSETWEWLRTERRMEAIKVEVKEVYEKPNRERSP